MNKATDILGREIKAGDIIASRSLEFGTTFRVLAVDGCRVTLIRAYRGRKPQIFDCRDFRIVSR